MIHRGGRQVVARRWRTAGLLFAALVIVALPYLITRGGSQQTLDAGERVTRSAEVQALAYRIANLTHESESAILRLLAGDGNEQTEEIAESAGKTAPMLLERLQQMTVDNPAEQQTVGNLSVMVNGRVALMQQALARYHANDKTNAYEAMHDASALFKIDALTSSITDSEEKLLQQRRLAAREQTRISSLMLALTAIAQMLVLAIVVIVSERQISKRLRAEQREGQAVQRSQLILQAVREPIAMLDSHLRTLLVNAAFSELYGVPEENRAQGLNEIGQGAWSSDALLQRLRDVLSRDRELWDYELTQRTVDGVERRVLVNARRLQQQSGESPALLLTVSDITARALVEQQVKELNQQLEGKVAQISDVNRELEAFSYSVSHDLRAPLRHIAGFALKLEGHLGEEADDITRHYLSVIRDASRRMAQLIDDLLVFSRLGRGALRLQPVDMQALVQDARVLSEGEAVGRQINWQIAPLPIIVCDENMLRTVWQNLLGNAVKYTGQCGEPSIEVFVRRDGEGEYEFTVADNGAGFDMRYADKLFGVFQRLHKASEFPGNGIGLANVRRIVTRHGGRVWAEGEPGHGARFYFTLPGTDGPESATRNLT